MQFPILGFMEVIRQDGSGIHIRGVGNIFGCCHLNTSLGFYKNLKKQNERSDVGPLFKDLYQLTFS